MTHWILAGLGNPGARYVLSRHNAGVLALDLLADRYGLRLDQPGYRSRCAVGRVAGRAAILLAPETYMNRSGEALRDLVAARPDDGPLVVLHDDLDLPLGRLRLKHGGGSGGHRGVDSIVERLGRTDFYRLRIGIDRPTSEMAVEDWVLSPFSEAETPLLGRVLETAADALVALLVDGMAAAMNRFNGIDLREDPSAGRAPDDAADRGSGTERRES